MKSQHLSIYCIPVPFWDDVLIDVLIDALLYGGTFYLRREILHVVLWLFGYLTIWSAWHSNTLFNLHCIQLENPALKLKMVN